jgi:hypothetical protein
LETQWQNGGARFYAPGKVPPHFPVHLETALRRGLESSQAVVAEQLQDFLKSMERRLRREVRNVEEYFLTLRQEMEVNLQRANLTEAQLEERRAKIAALPQELERQAVDLEHKYQVRVQVQPAAALRLLVDVVQLQVELKWRKLGRSLKVIFNPVTRSLDPLVCEGCGATIRRIYPAVAGNGVLLLCRSCSSSKGKK